MQGAAAQVDHALPDKRGEGREECVLGIWTDVWEHHLFVFVNYRHNSAMTAEQLYPVCICYDAVCKLYIIY